MFVKKGLILALSLILPTLGFSQATVFSKQSVLFDLKGRFLKVLEGTSAEEPTGYILKNPDVKDLASENIVVSFRFHDPDQDVLEFGGSFQPNLSILPLETIRSCIVDAIADTADLSAQEKLDYVIEQSQAFRKMDFLVKCPSRPAFAFGLIGYTAYNPSDFGNFLWGAAMAKLGFTYFTAKVGSECNAIFNTYSQNRKRKRSMP